jgi:hypothetical protein
VIPVVADTSTAEGIAHAHSTILAYCTSHDLLLRALVVVPSIISNTFIPTLPRSPFEIPNQENKDARISSSSRSREVSKVLEKEKLLYLSQATGTSTLSTKSLDTTRAALVSDVGDTMNVVASLVPALKSGGGRVVAIVPSAFRNVDRERDRWEVHEDRISIDDDDILEFGVTRKAILEMWSVLQKKVGHQGVQISQIHMSAARKQSIPQTGSNLKSLSSKENPIRFRKLATNLLSKAHYILYPVPRMVQAAEPYMDAKGNFVVPQVLPDDDSTMACPNVLLDAVRSVLVRSYPRAHYCVGLGPRLESVWECIPYHERLRGWVVDYLS